MPGVSGVTVVTTLVCSHYHCTQGCGRIERPAFPAPSTIEGKDFPGKTRAKHAARLRSRACDGCCLKIESKPQNRRWAKRQRAHHSGSLRFDRWWARRKCAFAHLTKLMCNAPREHLRHC